MAWGFDYSYKYKEEPPSLQEPLVVTLTAASDEQVHDVINGNVSFNGSPAVGDVTHHEPFQRTLIHAVLIGCILSLVTLLTIGGNLLVCVTIATNRKLRSNTNYFILSLATTDLLLGCVVLPFSAVITVNNKWPLGAAFCNIYTATDVMLCTVSILTLFAISLDRYFAVTTPLRYQQKMNGRVVLKCLTAIWIFSALMAFIPIHCGWNTPSGEIQNWSNPDYCLFELNKPYVLLVSLGTYFAPLAIMCGVYLKVLQITREQVREINEITKAGCCRASDAMLDYDASHDNKSMTTGADDYIMKANGHNGVHLAQPKARKSHLSIKARQKESRLLSDTKATVTLASVILAFAICWVPYFTLFTAKPFLRTEVNIHLDLVTLWLGYVNSSINPFLYAFYNSSFREGFRKILCGRWHRRRVQLSVRSTVISSRSRTSSRKSKFMSLSEPSEFSALKTSV